MRANFAGAEAVEQPIQPVEAVEANSDETSVAVEEAPRGNIAADANSGDAMQHYLREISVAELLTREQEVELAQRIEAGRAAMLAALTRSGVLRGAIKAWREGLSKGTVLLRDVVDLTATRQRLKGDAEIDFRRGRNGLGGSPARGRAAARNQRGARPCDQGRTRAAERGRQGARRYRAAARRGRQARP